MVRPARRPGHGRRQDSRATADQVPLSADHTGVRSLSDGRGASAASRARVSWRQAALLSTNSRCRRYQSVGPHAASVSRLRRITPSVRMRDRQRLRDRPLHPVTPRPAHPIGLPASGGQQPLTDQVRLPLTLHPCTAPCRPRGTPEHLTAPPAPPRQSPPPCLCRCPPHRRVGASRRWSHANVSTPGSSAGTGVRKWPPCRLQGGDDEAVVGEMSRRCVSTSSSQRAHCARRSAGIKSSPSRSPANVPSSTAHRTAAHHNTHPHQRGRRSG
jgi:hypothetical protein